MKKVSSTVLTNYAKFLLVTNVAQCRIKVARGLWHILYAGPLRRRLATFAISTGARETVGAKR